MSKTVYIAGPMTGIHNCNFDAFHFAAQKLRESGFCVLNPAEGTPLEFLHDRSFYIRRDIHYLLQADAIMFLFGWEQSKGAQLERAIACELGLDLMLWEEWYEQSDDREHS